MSELTLIDAGIGESYFQPLMGAAKRKSHPLNG
jgi:hypothetical protein